MCRPFFMEIFMKPKDFSLHEIPEESLDAVLALPEENKINYFCSLADVYFPDLNKESDEYINVVESYYASFYTEKLYRNNYFFREKFTAVYTNRGLIRNLVNNIYYLDEDLVVH